MSLTIVLLACLAIRVGAQTPACLPDTAHESIETRYDFGVRVSLTDAISVAERNKFGLPALLENQVLLVTDPVACANAGNAFYVVLGVTPNPNDRFIVLQAGNRRIVLLGGQTSHYTLHVVFDDTFSTVISKFWH